MAIAPDLRSAIARLTGRAEADLSGLWLAVSDAAQAREALSDILPALVQQYGAAAAFVAAEWYDEARAKAGVAGSFRAITAEIGDSGTEPLVGWALAEATDYAAFQSLIAGGVQRRISNFSRLTVTESAVADPQADGWQRVTDGNGCAFCTMLAGRGSVYSESGSDFASHDKCGCHAAPAFTGEPRPVKPYAPSARNITDADRARVHDWIATH